MPNSPFNHDNSSGDALQDSGMSRRNIIKYGGLAAGVVVATPTILTLGATPASASGTASFKFSQVDDTNSQSSSQTVGLAGLWVVAFAVKGFNASGPNNTATINTPAGWTAIGSQWGSPSGTALANRLTMALFYRYYATSPGSSNTVTFSHTGASTFIRAYSGYHFPRATVANSNLGSPSFSSNNNSSAGSVTTVGAQSKYLYFTAGTCTVVSGNGTPGLSNPSGYSGTSSNQLGMGIAALVPSSFAGASGSTSGVVTGTWASTGGTMSNRLAAIIAIS